MTNDILCVKRDVKFTRSHWWNWQPQFCVIGSLVNNSLLISVQCNFHSTIRLKMRLDGDGRWKNYLTCCLGWT